MAKKKGAVSQRVPSKRNTKSDPSKRNKKNVPEKEEDFYYDEGLDVGVVDSKAFSEEEDLAFQEEEALQLQRAKYTALNDDDFDTAHLLKVAAEHADHDLSVAGNNDVTRDETAGIQDEIDEIIASLAVSQGDAEGDRFALAKRIVGLPRNERKHKVKELNPEMVPLLEDIAEKLVEYKHMFSPIMSKLRPTENPSTSNGFLFLDCKNLIMLTYLSYLCYYLLLKTHGVPISTHPVIDRLVELRLLIEKLRPIESKLKYQIETIANSANVEDTNANKSLAPRPDLLLVGKPRGAGDKPSMSEESNIYVPPKLIATEYTGDNKKLTEYQKAARTLDYKRKKLYQSDLVKQLREELLDTPLEMSTGGTGNFLHDEETGRLLEMDRRRDEEEIGSMMRLPQSAKERNAMKLLKKLKTPLSEGATLKDIITYADEATVDPDVDDPTIGAPSKTSTSFTQYLSAARRAAAVSERDASAHNADMSVKFKKPSATTPSGNNDIEKVRVASDGDSTGDEEEIVDDMAIKRRRRMDAGKVPSLTPEEGVEGRRKISKAIQKNRGLVPFRKKYEANPRVHYRVKFEKKMKRHKAFNPTSRTVPGDGSYAGESSGIRGANVSRSRKLA